MASPINIVFNLSVLLFACFHLNVHAYSLNSSTFEKLVKTQCFRRSPVTGQELILGQNEPIGMSIENLISTIERLERLNPGLQPNQIIQLLLQRFHMDGIGGNNLQSNLEFQHGKLTEAILSSFNANNPLIQFNEEQLSNDEKCNLFFTLSHMVNQTATDEDHVKDVYYPTPKTAKAPSRDMGTEIVLSTKPTTPKAVQSGFVGDDEPNVPQLKPKEDLNLKDKKVIKRSVDELTPMKLTKKPREYGVASFLSSKSGPIASNRVLLGMFVGFSETNYLKSSSILKRLGKTLSEDVSDEEIDPLLSVTLGDLLGIDTHQGMSNPGNLELFGADGQWSDDVCHTRFVLDSNEGIWATSAELRGGLDGYNIGKGLQSLMKMYPNITASKVLRYYYSKNGLTKIDGVCQRNRYIEKDLNDDLIPEATKYLILWNSLFYGNQYSKNQVYGYIKEVGGQFKTALIKATEQTQAEKELCLEQYNDGLKMRPIESNLDTIFILDQTQRCVLGNQKQQQSCSQSYGVNALSKKLKLGRNGLGTVSILFNSRGSENPILVDDNMNPIVTPLHSTLFYSTSNECAMCKAANYDSSLREILKDRVELYNQLNLTLNQFNLLRANETGVPGRAIVMFDYGTMKPIPSDRIQNAKYIQLVRELLYMKRDFVYFGLATNSSSLKDLVIQEGNLITIQATQTESLVAQASRLYSERLLTVPSIFQYDQCQIRPSNNQTYNGFITPGYKQYWAMYPKTFYRSGLIELIFNAQELPIQVCFGRTPSPEMVKENCKQSSKANEEISWQLNTPCKDTIFEKCPPLYFTVTVDKADSGLCNDVRCMNQDQVSWTFKHFGISCNRSTAASVSIILLTFTILLSLFFK